MKGLSRLLVAVTGSVVLCLPAVAEAVATAPPTVTSLSVQLSGLAGGGRLTVHGTKFTGVQSVRFGTTPGTKLHVTSETTLLVTIPAHAAGLVNVTVVTSKVTSHLTKADQLRFVGAPTITSVSPTHGPAQTTTAVTVRGSGFYGVQKVLFGSVAGVHLSVTSPTILTIDAPTVTSGAAVPVRVMTRFGTSAVTAKSTYTYDPPPLPVTGLTASPTAHSVSLSWTPPAGATAKNIEIRRAVGSAPPTITSGQALTTSLSASTAQYRDQLSVAAGTTYAYSVFTTNAPDLSSAAATVVVTSASTIRPAPPLGLALAPSSDSPTLGPCGYVPAVLSTTAKTFSASAGISNPDQPNTPVRAEVELRDLGPTGSSAPTTVVAASNPNGWSDFSPAGATNYFALVQLPTAAMVSGHHYAIDMLASDGLLTSAPSVTCPFVYDAS